MDTKCSCGKQWTEAEFYALPALLGKCDCGLAIITGVHRLTCASAKPWILENDAPCDCQLVSNTSRHFPDCASLTNTVKYESVLCDACGTHRARLLRPEDQVKRALELEKKLRAIPVRCKARVQTGHANTQPPQCSKTTTAPSGYCASHKYLEGS